METNPNLGISTYDYHYRTCRCVYCNEVVILNQESLEILFQEELTRLRAENANNDFFFLTSREERAIKEKIQDYYRGSEFDYDQCIHDRCLALIMRPENAQLLKQIRLANRQNMILPDACIYNIYPITSSNVPECLNFCAFCHRMISADNPGFAYCLKSEGVKGRCLFLHNACYEALVGMRAAAKEHSRIARRNFIHLLTAGQPSAWSSYSVEELAARNDAWYAFLREYELTFDERDVLLAWLDFIRTRKAEWSEADLIGRWLPSLKYDDLTVLVDEQLLGQTLDELLILEGLIRAELISLPVPTRCLPVPQNNNQVSQVPLQSNVICLGEPSPSMRQPPLLYLNLVQTVRQLLTPSISFSAFSAVGKLPV